jgi:hypothetical protein
MTAAAQPIEINQDHEVDDGEYTGNPVDCFWTHGHGHHADDVIRAVLDHCMEEELDIPRINLWEDGVIELWQRSVDRGDFVEYVRANTVPEGHPRRDWQPITLLDLNRPGRGGPKCSVNGCKEPWSVGAPVQVVVEPAGGLADRTSVRMHLCRAHRRVMPEPSYRVCLVPVGAEILLPSTEAAVLPSGGTAT